MSIIVNAKEITCLYTILVVSYPRCTYKPVF